MRGNDIVFMLLHVISYTRLKNDVRVTTNIRCHNLYPVHAYVRRHLHSDNIFNVRNSCNILQVFQIILKFMNHSFNSRCTMLAHAR